MENDEKNLSLVHLNMPEFLCESSRVLLMRIHAISIVTIVQQ
jgi:hypothetical protein